MEDLKYDELKKSYLAKEELLDVVKTPCLHYFHKKCLEAWMRKRDECPNCRMLLPGMKGVEKHDDE